MAQGLHGFRAARHRTPHNAMRYPTVIALLVALGPGWAHAASTLTDFGTVAGSASAACSNDECLSSTSTVTDIAVFFAGITAGPFNGGVGTSSASAATGTWPAAGRAQSSATVGSGLAIPTLTAGAVAGPDAWIAGNALAVQLYEYTGTGETIKLDWSLSGTVANPDADLATGLTIYLGFFATGDSGLPSVSDPTSAFAALASAAYLSPEDNIRTFDDDGAVSESGSLGIAVSPGDSFYLAMGLTASAAGSNASAESLSTLTAAFDGSPSITPALTAVPLPGALWLLGAAVATLAGLGARRRRSP